MKDLNFMDLCEVTEHQVFMIFFQEMPTFLDHREQAIIFHTLNFKAFFLKINFVSFN